jgi:hypothetical protein
MDLGLSPFAMRLLVDKIAPTPSGIVEEGDAAIIWKKVAGWSAGAVRCGSLWCPNFSQCEDVGGRLCSRSIEGRSAQACNIERNAKGGSGKAGDKKSMRVGMNK